MIDDRNLTLPRLLMKQAEAVCDKPLLGIYGQADKLTYGELLDAALCGSARLSREFRLEPGKMVALYLGNSADYVRAWFCCLFSGVVDVPINPEFKKASLLFALRTMKVSAIFTTIDGVEQLLDPEVKDYLVCLNAVVVVGDSATDGVVSRINAISPKTAVIHLDELVSATEAGTVWEDIVGNAPASIRLTSGTTGAPKGVLLNHAHIIARSAKHNEILELKCEDILYSPFPFHHTLASINGFVGVLQAGASMFSAPRFSASRYFEDATNCGATRGHLLGSVKRLVELQAPGKYDRSHSLKYLWAGPRDLAFEERFRAEFVSIFGLSEIGCLAFKRGEKPGGKGSGFPVAEIDVRIHDGLDNQLPVGEIGEIVARPHHPNRIMLGYYNNAEATMRAFRNLWFHTGDAGFIDANGELNFVGRMGDTIRRRGVNISSEFVEQELREYEAVRDCAVIPVPSETGEHELHACIVWHDTAERETGDNLLGLVEFLEARLPKDYVPLYFEPMAEFPLTTTGKIRKGELRDRKVYGPTWDRLSKNWHEPRMLSVNPA